jgi:predicted PhzF superfamily epimerase YddE/YHI9
MKVTFVDVFATERLKGNNAAICFVDGDLEPAYMQTLAAELALPVTAFVDPQTLRRRWFAPKAELPLCGHGTLAAAHALWDSGLAKGPLEFTTQGGVLTAKQSEVLIEIDSPASPPKPGQDPGLEATPGKRPLWVGEGGGQILAQLDSEKSVRELSPGLAAIEKLPASGVVVTAPGGMVHVRLEGGRAIGGGSCITLLRGELA